MNTNNFTLEFTSLAHHLRAFAYTLTRDTSSAEDLFQETALRAFRHKEKYSANTNMKAWLSTIMKNAFINSFRRKKRQRALQDTTVEGVLLNSSDQSVLNNGEENLRLRELYRIIDDLDEGLKRPFLLAYEGYKYQEIHEIMGLPIGTIKSRIFMARKEMKAKIKERALV